jgi:hypothetical protein
MSLKLWGCTLECTNPSLSGHLSFITLCCHRPRVHWACTFYCPYLNPIAHTQDQLAFASLNRAGLSKLTWNAFWDRKQIGTVCELLNDVPRKFTVRTCKKTNLHRKTILARLSAAYVSEPAVRLSKLECVVHLKEITVFWNTRWTLPFRSFPIHSIFLNEGFIVHAQSVVK